MVIKAGQKCNRSPFQNRPPNYQGFHYSRQLIIKETDYDKYRNQHLCFEAVNADNRYLYRSHKVDLKNPIIAVKKRDNLLTAIASEDVKWRIGRAKNLILSQTDPYLERAGSLCEQVFAGSASDSLGKFNSISNGLDNIRLIEGYRHYCFEATDSDGNRTYVEVMPHSLGILVFRKFSDSYYAPATMTITMTPYLTAVSGDIYWEISGPSNFASCDKYVFNEHYHRDTPILSYREVNPSYNRSLGHLGLNDFNHYKFSFIYSNSVQNKDRFYYCLRATDQGLASTIS